MPENRDRYDLLRAIIYRMELEQDLPLPAMSNEEAISVSKFLFSIAEKLLARSAKIATRSYDIRPEELTENYVVNTIRIPLPTELNN